MADWYTGKVFCPVCNGNDGKMIVTKEESGYDFDYEEQCWTCGGSGWVSLEWLNEHYPEEVVQRCCQATNEFRGGAS